MPVSSLYSLDPPCVLKGKEYRIPELIIITPKNHQISLSHSEKLAVYPKEKRPIPVFIYHDWHTAGT